MAKPGPTPPQHDQWPKYLEGATGRRRDGVSVAITREERCRHVDIAKRLHQMAASVAQTRHLRQRSNRDSNVGVEQSWQGGARYGEK